MSAFIRAGMDAAYEDAEKLRRGIHFQRPKIRQPHEFVAEWGDPTEAELQSLRDAFGGVTPYALVVTIGGVGLRIIQTADAADELEGGVTTMKAIHRGYESSNRWRERYDAIHADDYHPELEFEVMPVARAFSLGAIVLA